MGRTNIVLTHDKKFRVPGALIVHDMEELHEELEKYNSEDIYVIGGESVYRQLIDECDVAHVTKSILHTMRMHISRIWMQIRHGR